MEEIIIISAVEPQKKKKDRYNIYSGGEYICSLSAESIVTYGIKEGIQIEEEDLQEAINADNTRYAFDSAVKMLSFKMRTEDEIRKNLKEKKIDDVSIDTAIGKLKDYGYVDDKAYAKEFVESYVASGRFGKKVVEYKLREKGIRDAIADEAMQIYTEEDELSIAQKQYEQMQGKYECEEKFSKRSKIYAALMRRGFSFDIINSVLSKEEDFE